MLNYENQFGFRSGPTTTHASMVENELHPSGKSLDFSKAYITVDHSVLLAELSPVSYTHLTLPTKRIV